MAPIPTAARTVPASGVSVRVGCRLAHLPAGASAVSPSPWP